MPKFGNSNARAGKGAPKATNAGAPRAKAPHRKGGASAETPTSRKPRHTAGGRDSRPATGRRFESDSRPARSSRFEADTRSGGPRRSFDSESKPERNGFKSRSNSNEPQRGARGSRFESDSRPPRDGDKRRDWSPSDSRKSRPAGSQRSFDSAPGSRGRKFDSNDRQRSSRFESDARPARTFDRDSRPARDSRDERPSTGRRFESDSRPARSSRFESDSSDSRKSRPAGSQRSFDSARGSRDGRPARSFEDRPKRNFDNGRPDRSDRVARDRDRDNSFDGARQSNPNKKAFFEDQKLERLESVDASTVELVGSFADLDLHPKMLQALSAMGVDSPFPIQAATIPAAIGGMDVLGRGKTGSGKTVAFTVPLITKLIAGGSQPRKAGKPRALILAPTRELADQIDRTANALAKSVGFFTACIYGGVPQRRQENLMSRGTDIVVATPGRLEDLMAQGIIDLSEVETIVIDEADHMCDLGFIEPVKRIMRATGDSQKLLFSATLDKEVDALVREFLPAPFVYEVPNEEQDVANIIHRVFTVDQEDRSQVLLRLVQGEGKSLIFARTKMTAERLSESLTAAGVPAARLHGDLNQNQRNRNLERFVKGHVRVLVATDVAARGIHVDDVALVIQVDPPEEYKTYLHRAGRTGRAGKEGTVITLIPRNRRRRMEDMLGRAERDGIFTEVRPSNPILEELAGPIAPMPAPEVLDFGDSRGGNGGGGRGRSGGHGSGGHGHGGGGRGRSASEARGGYKGGRGGSRPNRPGSNARAKDRSY